MARQLNKKQMEILDKFGNINSADNLPNDIYWSIVELNDFETIYQEINNYLYYTNYKRVTNNV